MTRQRQETERRDREPPLCSVSNFYLCLFFLSLVFCLWFSVCFCIGMAGRSVKRPVVFLQGECEVLDKGSWHPAAGSGTLTVGAGIKNEFSFRC